MSGKHTPGPWSVPHFADDSKVCNCHSVLSEGYAGAICIIVSSNGLSVGDGGNDAPPLDEAKANARLIAAAPDLLDALQSARKWLVINDDSRCQSDLKAVEATIAKAEGRAP